MYCEPTSLSMYAIQDLSLSDLQEIQEALAALKMTKYNDAQAHSKSRDKLNTMFQIIESGIAQREGLFYQPQ